MEVRLAILVVLGSSVLAGCAGDARDDAGATDALASRSSTTGETSLPAAAVASAEAQSRTFGCTISEDLVYGIDSTQAGTEPVYTAQGCALYDGSALGFEPRAALVEGRVEHGANATYAWRFRFQWGEETVIA